MTPTVIILCGIPTSGKSTWAENKIYKQHFSTEDFRNYRILCRDTIRLQIYKSYKNIPFTKASEKIVTERFNFLLNTYKVNRTNIIIDQTNCKEQYLNYLIQQFENTPYLIHIKFFNISLWKAFWRNIKRNLRNGKWIPWKALKDMHRNYNKINKSKYNEYT